MKNAVFVAGGTGMVGSAIIRHLKSLNIRDIVSPSQEELDFTNQSAVDHFFSRHKFKEAYIAAARVGGIHANNAYPAEFIYQNLMIECNLIHSAYTYGIEKVLFLGSSCIYPKMSEQPIKEESLLGGHLEPTNEPYAIAKITGIKLCESYNRQYGCDFRSLQPTSLYGPGDNFNPESSHVIPALIRRFHEAKSNDEKEVVVWGSGMPMREFLYVDDLAIACKFIMDLPRETIKGQASQMISHINVGTGEDHSIRDIAEMIKKITGFAGNIIFDTNKPDGTPRKLLEVSRMKNLGWQHLTHLEEGLLKTYKYYLDHITTKNY